MADTRELLKKSLYRVGKEMGKPSFSIKQLNNGVTQEGFTIKTDDVNIAPVIYIDDSIKAIDNGLTTVEEQTNEIIRMYREHMLTSSFDFSWFYSWENVKNDIVYRLVNKNANASTDDVFLRSDFMDLSYEYIVLISNTIDNGMSSVKIKKSYLEAWGVNASDVFNVAIDNTERLLGVNIIDLLGMLSNVDEENLGKAFIVTNNYARYGAINGFKTSVLSQIADMVQSNLFIIPCTVHEAIVINGEEDDVEEILDMIGFINANSVSEEDFLSNSLYVYDRELGIISDVIERR